MNFIKTYLVTIITALMLLSCGKKEHVGELSIDLISEVNGEGLSLGSTTYTLSTGDKIELTSLKYIISNIELYQNGELQFAENNSYHLINEKDGNTTSFIIDSVPVGEYDEIRMAIGVDEAYDNGSASGGDLGTSNGMFWINWGSYIYFRLDGQWHKNGTSTSPISHHVGGSNTYAPYALSASLSIADSENTTAEIILDVDQLYYNPQSVDLSDSTNHVIASAGAKMDMLGENLQKDMLKLGAVYRSK